MIKLHGEVITVSAITDQNKKDMYALMEAFYDDTDFEVFLLDLAEKDYCIFLFDEESSIQGFSTQKIMHIDTGERVIHGVFSGDTIIHKAYWGSLELYKVFGRYFMALGEKYNDFYWFLISKGYKTYKMLPLFFKEYYPNDHTETPAFEQNIMDVFGILKYPEEYDKVSGVIRYKGTKDKLKPGVADITDKQLRDKDILYFLKMNPEYLKGYDLVCLTRLMEDNLKPEVHRLIMGM